MPSDESTNPEDDILEDHYRIPDSPFPLVLVILMTIMWLITLVSTILIFNYMIPRLKTVKSKTAKSCDVLVVVETITDFLSVSTYTIQIYSRQGFGVDLEVSYEIFCKALTSFYCFNFSLSTDIIVCLSSFRFMVVYYAFKVKKLMKFRVYVVVFTAMFLMALVPSLLFPIIRSTHITYSKGFRSQHCGTQKENSLLSALPFLIYQGLHLFLPSVCGMAMVFVGIIEKPAEMISVNKNKKSPVASAMHNNTVAALSVLQGFPVCILYLYKLMSKKSAEYGNTIVDFATLLSLLPKCVNFWILYFFSPSFRKVDQKVLFYKSFASTIGARLSNMAARRTTTPDSGRNHTSSGTKSKSSHTGDPNSLYLSDRSKNSGTLAAIIDKESPKK